MRVLLMSVLVLASLCLADDQQITGRYWTADKNGVVELYMVGDELRGRVIWRSSPLLDLKNPDSALRGRSMVGVTFLDGFKYDTDGIWRGGQVYSPNNGKTYSGKIWLDEASETLMMRGYVGISLLGRTATFTKLTKAELAEVRL